jgi:TonB-linked SusC/RagA family outer membrane protein
MQNKLRIIKISLGLFFLCIAASAYSQQTLLSLNKEKVALKEVLDAIEKQSEYVFFFSDEINSELIKKVSLHVENQPLNVVLDQVLASVNLSYTLKDRQVSLFKIKKDLNKGNASTETAREKRTITGNIVDNFNEPLPGVTIQIRGTRAGTITDMEGNFSLEVNANDVLEISYLGFADKIIKVDAQNRFKIRLEEKATELDDLVIVGYSTQRKETVTGSISSISTKDLLQSPQANISNALGGRMPGILSVQRTGEPGADMSMLRIRGVGTFATNKDNLDDPDPQNPLIMVDGIEVNNLNNIDPNEVEAVSILKDASATAVYGVRGANGVILVTTRRGATGKPVINVSSNVALTNFPFLPEPMNSYEYAKAYNEAQKYDYYSQLSYSPRYPDDVIEAYRTNSDPLLYPDRNWYDYMLKDFSTQTQTNLNISGGTEKVRYFVSLGYFTQNGMFDTQVYDAGYDNQIKFKRYNMRSNFDINITKNFLLSLDISNQMGNLQSPNWDTRQIMETLNSIPSNSSPGVVDNKVITLSDYGAGNPVGPFTRGWKQKYENNLNGSVRFAYTMDYLTKGLSLRGAISYKNFNTETKKYNDKAITYEVRNTIDGPVFIPSAEPSRITYEGTNDKNTRIYAEAGMEYARRLGIHNMTALLLYNQGKYYSPSLQYHVPNGYQGLVGRITYSFKNRYLAEYNIGYNGTENFAPGKRFGFFPAYSLGWVVTEEAFMPENDILTFLKIRGSYGTVGNDVLGGSRFLYLPSAYTHTDPNKNFSYYFGEVGKEYNGQQGSDESKVGNPLLTWERADKMNGGVDVIFWKDKISLTLDYFREERNNILCNRNTTPTVIGISAKNLPAYNMGRMKNSGIDGELVFNDRIGTVDYFIRGNYTYAHNIILEQDEVIRNEDYLYHTGQRYDQFFGYIADGIFNSWEEVNAAGRPEYSMGSVSGNKVQPGDIRYVDVNGDGKINDDDQVPIGYSDFPEIMFGLSLGASYRGFDVSVLFQGASHVSNMPSRRIRQGFYANTGANSDLLKSWSFERHAAGQEIVYPRYGSVGNAYNYEPSTFWLEDASYLRLKNFEIGYTFKNKGLKNIGITSVRLYSNGINLITWTKNMLPGQDPEITKPENNQEPYPVTRIFNFGFNVNF